MLINPGKVSMNVLPGGLTPESRPSATAPSRRRFGSGDPAGSLPGVTVSVCSAPTKSFRFGRITAHLSPNAQFCCPDPLQVFSGTSLVPSAFTHRRLSEQVDGEGQSVSKEQRNLRRPLHCP